MASTGTCGKVLAACDLIIGILVVILGVMVLLGGSFTSIVLGVAIILGGAILAIVALTAIGCVSTYMLFVMNYIGRGISYIILGCLALPNRARASFTFIVGLICIIYGILVIILALALGMKPVQLMGGGGGGGESSGGGKKGVAPR